MSNLPSLLRQKAEGLRKEASDYAQAAETAYHAALTLVKAAETNDLDTYYRARMAQAAEDQVREMERARAASSVDSRISRLTDEDIAELKNKIAAIEGHSKAWVSAREDAPVSTGLRSLVGAGVGAAVLGGANALINKKMGMSPLVGAAGPAVFGGLIGAGYGALSGVAAKDRYARGHVTQDPYSSLGHTAASQKINSMSKHDVERYMHNLAPVYGNAYPVEHLYEDMEPDHVSHFYKQASQAAVQELLSQGAIGLDVAEAALAELNRRFA